MSTILVVDDEVSIRKTLGMLLRKNGYYALDAADLSQAKQILDNEEIDLIITDMRLEDEDGMDLLTHLKNTNSQVESIVLTAYASIETAVEAMRLGAYDYLTKPINPDELLMRVTKVLERKLLREEVTRLRNTLSCNNYLKDIVAESKAMKQILSVVQQISNRDIPVLITGETGVGKEIIARAIHETSARSDKSLVAINCCTLPEELMDSELFGHIKGSFTGATKNHKGLFQQADCSTLFLDEIGDISPRLQAKLLRVLQEGEIRPVGGTSTVRVDVRIIAATNHNLEKDVEDGKFRSDLLYRLNVLPIAIPPLRSRRCDIIPLVKRFLHRLQKELGRDDLSLNTAAQKKIMSYDWPGNVRQLENIIERSFALSPGPVLSSDEIIIAGCGAVNPDKVADVLCYALNDTPILDQSEAGVNIDIDAVAELSLKEVETRHIRRILTCHGGNQVTAARSLGVSRSTLRRKILHLDK